MHAHTVILFFRVSTMLTPLSLLILFLFPVIIIPPAV